MPNKKLFDNVEFIASVKDKKAFKKDLPVFTFLGRSNVGKSTLINTLCYNPNLMKASKKPGRTQMINYCRVDEKFYLADVPGYGFARFNRSEFAGMMKDFLEENPSLVKAYILIDSRRLLQTGDLEFASYLESLPLDYSYVFTKYDKLSQSEKHFLDVQLEKIQNEKKDVPCFVSSFDSKSLDPLRKDILSLTKKR